ncbi:MAG TPA: His/Gly/Thr/Pro-type tRNA ligase C-terminal domain-containing protein, partial [Pyrinomonadaceae bacterium]|nr:His/Gly/Thr/Pro-type tRNA ligase C-terminal domain-containing protein [Pyrinomonadaceae bacterium]
ETFFNPAWKPDFETKRGKELASPEINFKLLKSLKEIVLKGKSIAKEGFDEIEKILFFTSDTKTSLHLLFNNTLARGLSYYTGAIFEIVLTEGDFAGSIGGGGRYDGLIGMFGKEQIPACGFSLGLERILVVMDERGMFPPELETNAADVMVTIWNEDSIGESLKLANELRQQGLRVLVYPEADKLGKQFKYADSINIPFVCVLGESELAENKVTLKNMQTGEQETILRGEIGEKVKQ